MLYQIRLLDRGEFIDRTCKLLAKHNIMIPIGWCLYAHHCTVFYGSEMDIPDGVQSFIMDWNGKTIDIKITGIGVSDTCIAFRVEACTVDARNNRVREFKRPFSANRVPHITLFVQKGRHPVESNNIARWIPMDGGLCKGIVEKAH